MSTFSNPGADVCPWCGIVPSEYCFWGFLPFSAATSPESLFFSSFQVAADAVVGVPPDPSENLTVGVEYSLVSVVYLILGGFHYVTQFRLKGKWLKYDCASRRGNTSASSFDSHWHSGEQVLYMYVKTDLLVVAGESAGETSGDSAFLRALARVQARERAPETSDDSLVVARDSAGETSDDSAFLRVLTRVKARERARESRRLSE